MKDYLSGESKLHASLAELAADARLQHGVLTRLSSSASNDSVHTVHLDRILPKMSVQPSDYPFFVSLRR